MSRGEMPYVAVGTAEHTALGRTLSWREGSVADSVWQDIPQSE